MSLDPLSPDGIIDILRRNTPQGYIDMLLAEPDSAAVINGIAAVFSRADLAIQSSMLAGLISTAPAGSPGTSGVTISRAASGTFGAIPKGYLFRDARGFRYVLQTSIAVAALDLAIVVPVESLRQIEIVISPDDPGMAIDGSNLVVLDSTLSSALIAPPGDPSAVSTTFQAVDSSTPVVGATSNYLAVLGDERGTLQQVGEDAGAYRTRVQNIPDVVSPDAISMIMLGVAQRIYGFPTPWMEEPFDMGETPAAKAAIQLRSFDTTFMDDSFFDDPAAEVVSFREARFYFRIVVEGLPFDPTNFYSYFDDGFFDDPVYGFFDGATFSDVASAILAAMFQEVDTKRGHGLQWDLLVDGYHQEEMAGSTTAAILTSVATAAPAAGHAWHIVEGFAGLRSDVPPAIFSFSGVVTFTFTDATTFDLPGPFMPVGGGGEGTGPYYRYVLEAMGFPFEKLISGIALFAASDGVSTLKAFAHFWLVDVVL